MTRKPTKKSQPRKFAGEPDFSVFANESLTESHRNICLACVTEIFTRVLGLAQRTAYNEIRKYTPSLAELTAAPVRPYFHPADRCPYCNSPAKWHAPLGIYRIEGGKATDIPRRKLATSIADSDKFAILEQKATQKEAFFSWLDHVRTELSFETNEWLRDLALHHLARKDPKTGWPEIFRNIRAIRRSRRIEEGWEIEEDRIFLAPMLFDELLLVQYLISRSQKAGGLTLEGRYTFGEMIARLRRSGYLRHIGAEGENASELFDQLLEKLGGGEASVRFYYFVDRREFLERAKSAQALSRWRPSQPATAKA